jgi:hypothetical protein
VSWTATLGFLLIVGCFASPAPLEVNSAATTQDHHVIADYYRREAHIMKLRAEEQRQRIAVYERLFGADSEWVSGARLLAQFYGQAAADYEQKAEAHQALAHTAGSADGGR